MKFLAWCTNRKTVLLQVSLIALILILTIPLAAYSLAGSFSKIRDLEYVSIGSGGVQGDGSSFHVSTSNDGRYAAFISLSRNWTAEPPAEENWVDVYVRDRLNDELIKITYAYDGGSAEESSLDPVFSADGRYVTYFSFATNLVPDDTNDHPWLRRGLDVFLYDMQARTTQRVSLTSQGGEISGMSTGVITPDGRYIVLVSDGYVILNQPPGNKLGAVYLRDWKSGSIIRISKALDGGFPDKSVETAVSNFDGRYIVYSTDASNLVANDTNGETDIFIYDRITDETRRISNAFDGGNSNGRSSKPQMTYDGRYTTFLSSASNLVVGDTNGVADIFVYDMVMDSLQRVSVADDGSQSNGLAKDPSICADGRFVSFTTEATNLVPGDTNGERDVILHDLLTGRNTLATVNGAGEWANGEAHRSYLVPDCRAITFASDATNMVAGDANEERDIFMGQIYYPADFSHSTVTKAPFAEPGDVLTYTYAISNIGYETGLATLVSRVPTNTIYLAGSATGGAIFNSHDNQVTWQGELTAGSDSDFSYAVTVDAGLIDPTVIVNRSVLAGGEQEWLLDGYTVVNGWQSFLPIIIKN